MRRLRGPEPRDPRTGAGTSRTGAYDRPRPRRPSASSAAPARPRRPGPCQGGVADSRRDRPVTRARSTAARSSGRKWTRAGGTSPSTMPAMSRSDQPRVGRIRFTTTRTGRRRGARAGRRARAPAGTARPGRRCPPPRPRRRRRARPASAGCGPAPADQVDAGSSSRLKPVSTTTWPWPRATSRRCSTTPARTSTQRSARGRPVTTVSRWSSARCTEPNRSASAPSPVSRAAVSRPETSSRTPSCWATAPP